MILSEKEAIKDGLAERFAELKVGDTVKKGQTVCYIEAMKTFNAIAAECDGVITEICHNSGDTISEDDVLMKIKG